MFVGGVTFQTRRISGICDICDIWDTVRGVIVFAGFIPTDELVQPGLHHSA
jgi:hypothetical protein